LYNGLFLVNVFFYCSGYSNHILFIREYRGTVEYFSAVNLIFCNMLECCFGFKILFYIYYLKKRQTDFSLITVF